MVDARGIAVNHADKEFGLVIAGYFFLQLLGSEADVGKRVAHFVRDGACYAPGGCKLFYTAQPVYFFIFVVQLFYALFQLIAVGGSLLVGFLPGPCFLY